MASCGAAVQRTSATSTNPSSQTQPNESKQIPNLENKKPFSFQILYLFSIPSILESATSRIIEDLRKFGLYYAEFMWIVLFILLLSERKVSLVCLVAMKEVAILYWLFCNSVANSVMFRWLIAFDTRPIVLPLLAIGTCLALIFTGAGIHLLITLALTFPIVLAHAVLCVAEDFSLDKEIDQESVPLVHTV
uniref:PRA1 family protein n=1 Tax=Solanum tuberosum TaxID=4113 RepID=M1D2X2_SOLTU